MKHTDNLAPVKSSERYIILDALRGFALLGICMANFPEFSLYTFLKAEAAAAFPSAGMDSITRYLLYVFVDGKFYTLFSLLFGIGFSIIISNAARKGANGFRIFYRRMFLLACIGFLHLMFIWSGDILMLYALLGMLLPLFRHASDRTLLAWAAALLLTSDNFAYWLRDAQDYQAVFQFLIQGALVRVQEFIDGNRYFKVMGLFLIGFYIGRRKIYASLEERKEWLQGLCRYGLLIGLPLSLVYAWSCQNGHPWGLTVHSLLYLVSVYPTGFAYAAGISLLYLRWKKLRLWSWLAAPGRMALSSYIGQSVIGMFLFYGIGLGWGAGIGLLQTEGIVLGVYLFQMLFCLGWLKFFRFGPLEWIWRMLTYGRWFSPFREK